jgi:GxxExxY protein
MALIDTEPFTRRIIGCAIEVHKTLGPGLIESIYEAALSRELNSAGLQYARQRKLPVLYKGEPLALDLRMDLVVEDTVVVEIKSVQSLLPIHEAQLQTYLKISGLPVGLLLNFNVTKLTDGVRRRLL